MNGYEYQKGGLSDDEYTPLDYWQEELDKAEREVGYWETQRSFALKMIENYKGGKT